MSLSGVLASVKVYAAQKIYLSASKILAPARLIADRLPESLRWAAQYDWAVLLTAGFTAIQVEEYLVADVFWAWFTVVLVARAITWSDRSVLARILSIAAFLAICAVLVTWTQTKRADKPWSAFKPKPAAQPPSAPAPSTHTPTAVPREQPKAEARPTPAPAPAAPSPPPPQAKKDEDEADALSFYGSATPGNYPDGTVIAGIAWKQNYLDFRVSVTNRLKRIVTSLDVTLEIPDLFIAEVGQLTNLPNVTFVNAPNVNIQGGWLTTRGADGREVTVSLPPIARSNQVKVRAEKLYGNDTLTVVIAVLSDKKDMPSKQIKYFGTYNIGDKAFSIERMPEAWRR